ncbi:MAG: winged helix-turn-helix transcriptional regulator [Bacteroidetes bacterium]|nr:winged helix-turn-helix transcriptional regulator [Bacteroidota bacterium]
MTIRLNTQLEFENIFVTITKLKRKLDAQIEAELHWRGYKNFKSSYLPIFILLYKYPSTVVQIAEAYGITKQGISKLSKEMMAEGFIKTLVNKEDRRSTHLLLTAKGKRLATEARKCIKKLNENYKSLLGFNKFDNMNDMLVSLLALHE